MITLLTDSVDPWLTYIWEQFARINCLRDEYQFATYGDYQNSNRFCDSHAVIEYGPEKRLDGSLFLLKRPEARPNQIIWKSPHLPIYRDSCRELDGKPHCDLLYNAFFRLSRMAEWHAEKKGRSIRSYASRHPEKTMSIWRIPVVNFLFHELEKQIREHFPGVRFGSSRKPVLTLSHDVDYLDKTIQLRIKKTAWDGMHLLRRISKGRLKGCVPAATTMIDFVRQSSRYRCFEAWHRLESELGIKSVYYFYARNHYLKSFRLRRWILDPSYDITADEPLRNACRELMGRGHTIGLHAGFFAAQSAGLFQAEKEILEKVVDAEITKCRHHWLNYVEAKTPYIHAGAGIREDSTIGFNDIPGFRAGIASVYHPYDHINQRAFAFKEIPMVMMDAHIHSGIPQERSKRFDWLTEPVPKIKKFNVSVDWHQRGIHSDYAWHEAYLKLVNAFQERI
jgi:hypothetical protein